MKLSEPRSWIILGLILGLCFAIGFGIGAFPSRWRELQGEKPQHLSLLVSDARLIPQQFFLDYEKATGKSIDVKVVSSFHLFRIESQKADLLFAPLSWLASFPENLKTLPDQTAFHDLLSTDFATMQLAIEFFLPILWKTEKRDDKTHLLFWGFATPSQQGTEAREFLTYLLTSKRRLKEWATVDPDLAFTLQLSNETKDLPPTQKAAQIRSVSLADLVIDQKELQSTIPPVISPSKNEH
jgi:hypothetical protein